MANSTSYSDTSKAQDIARILLGAILVVAGIGHLTFARTEFQVQVPDWVPLNKDLTVVLSGYVEILLGLAILFVKRYRAQIGLFAGLFFIMVFPGNIAQYLNHRDGFGLDTDLLRFIRLLFQPVLVAWAWWSSGGWQFLKQRSNSIQ